MQSLQENTCVEITFLINLQAGDMEPSKNGTPTQVFSCEFCEISKKFFFDGTAEQLLLKKTNHRTANI